MIKEVCENVSYKTISVLPSQEELLLGYSHKWNIGLDTVHTEHEVVHFNLSTGEEQIIALE